VAFEPNKRLMARVERAVAAVLEREGHLTYPALLSELGVLTKQDLEAWRAGRAPYLEQVIRTNLTRLSRIQTAVRRLARARNWKRTVTGLRRGRRYSKTSHPFVEEEYGDTMRGKLFIHQGDESTTFVARRERGVQRVSTSKLPRPPGGAGARGQRGRPRQRGFRNSSPGTGQVSG
jgi:hypothetical protein